MIGALQDVTLRIATQAQGRKWKGLALRLLASIGLWAAVGGWKHPTALILVAIAFPAVMLTLTAVIERFNWKQVDIAPDSLTLIRDNRTVVIRGEDLVFLELRDKVILIKWRGDTRGNTSGGVASLTRERYRPEDWTTLQEGLRPWAKAPEKTPD